MAIIYIWLITPSEKRIFLKAKIGVLLLPLLFLFLLSLFRAGEYIFLKNRPGFGRNQPLSIFFSQIKVAVNYYLLKLFLPFNLNFEPDIRLLSGIMDWQFVFASGVFGTGVFMVYRHKSLILQFAVLWFVITLLPTSSFVPLKQIATEHRTYLPGLGFSLVLGLMFLSVPRVFATRLLVVFLSLSFLLTVTRSLDYRSEVLIWEDTAKKSPNKPLVHNNLATAYMEAEMFLEAERELAVTLQLNPTQSDAYANLGHIHFQRKNWKQAIEEFKLRPENPITKELLRSILLGSNKSEHLLFFRSCLE